jgi:hypothetical protein
MFLTIVNLQESPFKNVSIFGDLSSEFLQKFNRDATLVEIVNVTLRGSCYQPTAAAKMT